MCHSYQFEEGQESVGEQGSGVRQLMRHVERSEDMRAPRRFSSPIHIASIRHIGPARPCAMPTRATPEEPSALWRRAQLKSTAVVALAEPVASKKRLERRPTASKSRTVAKGSRVSSVSSGYLYFLVLERSWWFCLVLALTLYTISILVCSLLAATGPGENRSSSQ